MLTLETTSFSAPPTESLHARVAALLAQGYGESHLHPHIPFVGQGPAGPALMWRAICTGRGCGLYMDDTPIEPPIDELCDDCLMSGEL